MAYTYQNITEKVIKMVQSYIQEEMDSYLAKNKCVPVDRMDNFGEYADDPTNFEFTIGEYVLIQEM